MVAPHGGEVAKTFSQVAKTFSQVIQVNTIGVAACTATQHSLAGPKSLFLE
jgi:hypothetical protein